MPRIVRVKCPALSRYRDLIEQGESPACAQARVEIEHGVKLSPTWQALAERGPLAVETW